MPRNRKWTASRRPALIERIARENYTTTVSQAVAKCQQAELNDIHPAPCRIPDSIL
jgi:hypothetical protein